MDSLYTEEWTSANTIPKPSRGLRIKAEQDQYTGNTINQTGEIAEYKVFRMLHQLCNVKQNDQFIVLKNVDLDNNNDNSIKEDELRMELPTIDLSHINMNSEHDIMLIIRNVGIILLEVKASSV